MQEHDRYTGQVLDGRYRVERLLGKGGMGAVYEGRHAIVGKRVAIKMLHAEFAANEEVLKRFYREAQAAAAIGHKNIIDIMDVGVTPANEPYLVMEYLEGEDLEGMLRRTGPVSVEAACGILEPALLALEAAHAKGIVHRDLKPANIFLVRNEGSAPTVKLIDFGISKFTGGNKESRLTRTGSLLGTPAYMAPEQARGMGDIDHRADVYSMGVILYQMLTGALPFEGENYNALLINVLTTEARRPREINRAIPADAEAVVLKELSKSPGERSQSAKAMLESLKALGGFAERASGMSLLGTRIHNGVASGDLGSVPDGSGSPSSASRVLSEMARGTPGAWSGTAARKGPSRALIVGVSIGVVAVVAAVAVVLLARGNDAKPEPNTVPFAAATPPVAASQPAPVVPAAAPEKTDTVEIRVAGAPDGAEILFDGATVPVNPFPVGRRVAFVKLEVRAEGYRPFATMIAPSEDRIVEVSLEKETKKGGAVHRKGDRDKADVAPPAISPTASPSPVPKSDDGLKAGKKGTKFGKEFE